MGPKRLIELLRYIAEFGSAKIPPVNYSERKEEGKLNEIRRTDRDSK